MATIPERVNAFITSRDVALCDRCIQEELDIVQNNQVQQITATLATTSEFVREQGRCPGCGRLKMLSRATRSGKTRSPAD